MTYDAARGWDEPAAGRCQPGLVQLRRWFEAGWGSAQFAGCYADRPMSGGSVPSVHRDGRALDVNFGRPGDFAAAVEWVVAHGERVGVQQLLDYRGDRSWRPGRGWRPWDAPAGKSHLHVEMSWAGALDVRPIADRLTEVPVRLVDVVVRCVDGRGEAVAWVDPAKVVAVSGPTAFGAVAQVGWRADVRADGGVQVVVAVEDWFPGAHDVTVRVACLP